MAVKQGELEGFVQFSFMCCQIPCLVTMLGMSFGGLLGGTMIVETVFSWNGIGSAAVAAISGRDYQLIQGYVMWMGCIYVLVNLLVDISYQWLDPRIRRGALQHEE